MHKKRIPRHRTAVGMFCIGGVLYNLIEILWRGHTHWSMFLLGGLCFQVIGGIHERLVRRSLWLRCSLCAGAITVLEFLCGCVVNLHWRLNVWDYSRLPLNIKGQVCLLYSVLWGILSLIAYPVYRFVKMWFAYRQHGVLQRRGATLSQRAIRTAGRASRTDIPTE